MYQVLSVAGVIGLFVLAVIVLGVIFEILWMVASGNKGGPSGPGPFIAAFYVVVFAGACVLAYNNTPAKQQPPKEKTAVEKTAGHD